METEKTMRKKCFKEPFYSPEERENPHCCCYELHTLQNNFDNNDLTIQKRRRFQDSTKHTKPRALHLHKEHKRRKQTQKADRHKGGQGKLRHLIKKAKVK